MPEIIRYHTAPGRAALAFQKLRWFLTRSPLRGVTITTRKVPPRGRRIPQIRITLSLPTFSIQRNCLVNLGHVKKAHHAVRAFVAYLGVTHTIDLGKARENELLHLIQDQLVRDGMAWSGFSSEPLHKSPLEV